MYLVINIHLAILACSLFATATLKAYIVVCLTSLLMTKTLYVLLSFLLVFIVILSSIYLINVILYESWTRSTLLNERNGFKVFEGGQQML